MAYADQQGMSTGRLVSIALVILLHVFLGYAFVTGLAYEAVKKAAEKLNVVDVTEEKPPEEEPPPPPPDDVLPPPPPVFAQDTQALTENKSRQTTDDTKKKVETDTFFNCPDGTRLKTGQLCKESDVTRQCPNGGPIINVTRGEQCPTQMQKCEFGPDVPVTAKCAEKPKDKFKPTGPTPRNNVNSWVTTDDYPSRDLQQEHQGSVSVQLTVDATGRVSGCSVTSGSGFPGLDSATCSKIKSRAKFNPAKDSEGNATTGTYPKSVRWVVPKE